ncbi:putative integral membrane protein [Rosellinia necatrix]|uniref:Putative integral membrane protein n=1 Tax=Rosellinia necatrix TaxID=77044 RepID=A0A1S7UNM2_ROSNE|nr:putative integral membrane protein [Rosellinia necatrix]
MGNSGQGISSSGFLGVLWTLTGLATLLLIGRLLIRGILVKTFHLDDLFAAIAWLLTTIAISLATVITPPNYEYGAIIVGEIPTPPPAELAQIAITLRRWNLPSQVFFWTALYCVKLSFMFLYRVIFNSHREYRYVWLAATTYIVLSYGISLIGVFGQCGDVRNLLKYEECMTSYVKALDYKFVWIDFFFNVTSDFAVAILPIPGIWRLNMHTKQKLAVTGICSLAIVTVAFETVRTVKLYTQNFALTNLYSYLELVIAVLIGMLPSYRFLVSPADKDREYRRLFWSRVTLREYSSDSSAHELDNAGRRYTGQSERPVDSHKADLETAAPLPPLNPV